MLLIALYVALATAAHGAEPEVHVLGAPGEPAGSFCGRCADGDFLVDNGSLELVIGGSHRRDESFYKFPTADTLGSIVFHRFAVTGARSDIMLGTPYVRVGRTTTHVRFDNVEMERSGNLVAFVANGLYRDGQRVQVQFEGCYAIAEGSKRVDISLTATNVGPNAIEDFIYSIFFNPHQIYDFSPADVAGSEARDRPRGRLLKRFVLSVWQSSGREAAGARLTGEVRRC